MKPKTEAVKNPTPLRILQRARNLVRYGWVKGTERRATMQGYSFCSIGAINAAGKGGTTSLTAATRIFSEHVPNPYQNTPVGAIVSFNDAQKTRKADVLRAFDRAIKYMKGSQ